MQEDKHYPQETVQYVPDRDLGELFKAVQLAQTFTDAKTFVDAVALSKPAEIVAAYEAEKDAPNFSLKDFVQKHFLPPAKIDSSAIARGKDMIGNLKKHWSALVRQSHATAVYQSLINLPRPFVVPGGRFREMFYWDSYFTIIGLLESKEDKLAFGMIENFEHLIQLFGYIPNGNRTYFLTRSQPPFFGEMLKAYAARHSKQDIIQFLPALEKEYQFWTKDDDKVNEQNVAVGKSVWLNGAILHRYTGTLETPRAEGWNKEYKWALDIAEADRPAFHRNMRAACESGWDFSSRWFADGKNRSTVRCEDLVPVCLNSLLYSMEMQLADMYQYQNQETKAANFMQKAVARKSVLQQYCWQPEEGVFTDYDFTKREFNHILSLATVYPLFFGLATRQQADAIAKVLVEKFFVEGGLVTTLIHSGEQWDAPNGWAPLQWLAVIGLHKYGHTAFAKTVAEHWLKVNEHVYHNESKMMEKYNVMNPSLPGGGGNYENQDGFGWTNGVAIALSEWLKTVKESS